MRVACCSYESLRLVHYDIDFLLAADSLSVESDVIAEDIDLGTELGDNLSVDGHDTCLDVLVSLAA